MGKYIPPTQPRWSDSAHSAIPPVWKDRLGKLLTLEWDDNGDLLLVGDEMVKFDALQTLPTSYDKLFVWDCFLEGVKPVLLSLNPAFFQAWRELVDNLSEGKPAHISHNLSGGYNGKA